MYLDDRLYPPHAGISTEAPEGSVPAGHGFKKQLYGQVVAGELALARTVGLVVVIVVVVAVVVVAVAIAVAVAVALVAVVAAAAGVGSK